MHDYTSVPAVPPQPHTAPSQAAQHAQDHPFYYDGRIPELYKIWLINIFLTIITLGFYRFWGKTRIRRYIASSFTLIGDRFEYSGKGWELCKGFLMALPIFMIIFIPPNLIDPQQHPLVSLVYIPFFFLIHIGIYGAIRYRLSRLSWRGIRGWLGGSVFTYAAIAFALSILSFITLGLLKGYADQKRLAYMMRNVWFGSSQANFTENASNLQKTHFITWFLFIFTFGLSRFWYRAALFRYQFNNLQVEDVRLSCSYTGGGLLSLFIGNMFLLIVTLGLGIPLIIQRKMRYFSENVMFVGNIEQCNFMQSTHRPLTSGEGLEAVFALDTGIV